MRSLRGKDLLIATGNAGKLAEFSALLAPFDTRVLSLKDFGLVEPEETEVTFRGNARLKARAASVAAGVAALADDSGLVVDCLGGLPGIYTADWAEGRSGRDFGRAMTRTLALATAMGRSLTAHFYCCLALAQQDEHDVVFSGQLDGNLVWPMRGADGHGYDPIFQPAGSEKTMGELSTEDKNLISHRAIAVRNFTAACFT